MKTHFLVLACASLLTAAACDKNTDTKTLDFNLNKNSIYKIIPVQNYDPQNTDDCIKLMPLDIESGFIHASFGNQIENILQKFFKGKKQALLIELDTCILNQHGLDIRREQNKPNGDFFPHIYGAQQIPAHAILKVIKALEKDDGSWIVE
jgi:uncharacterized protein (DUF952 family)